MKLTEVLVDMRFVLCAASRWNLVVLLYHVSVCEHYSTMKCSCTKYVHSYTRSCDGERVGTAHSSDPNVAHAQWGRCRSGFAVRWQSLLIGTRWGGRWREVKTIELSFSFPSERDVCCIRGRKTYKRHGLSGRRKEKLQNLCLFFSFASVKTARSHVRLECCVFLPL